MLAFPVLSKVLVGKDEIIDLEQWRPGGKHWRVSVCVCVSEGFTFSFLRLRAKYLTYAKRKNITNQTVNSQKQIDFILTLRLLFDPLTLSNSSFPPSNNCKLKKLSMMVQSCWTSPLSMLNAHHLIFLWSWQGGFASSSWRCDGMGPVVGQALGAIQKRMANCCKNAVCFSTDQEIEMPN